MSIDPMIRYSVHLIPLCRGVREAVTENEDGSYTIFIDSGLSSESQKTAFWHAMSHITNEDFNKDDVQHIEMCAHGI